MTCDTCKKIVPDNNEHTFVSSAYKMKFCEECCPIDFDGLRCASSHKRIRKIISRAEEYGE